MSWFGGFEVHTYVIHGNVTIILGTIQSPLLQCTNASHIFVSRSVHPGEEFSFAAVLVGAEFGAVTGSVNLCSVFITDKL